MVFRFGLGNLPLEPPDNSSALLTEQPDGPSAFYSPADFASIGTQRVGEAQVVPAQFRRRVRRVWPPSSNPGQGGGLAPGGGSVTEIPMPESWKTLGALLQLLPDIHPMAPSRRGGGRDNKYRRCIQAANGDTDGIAISWQ